MEIIPFKAGHKHNSHGDIHRVCVFDSFNHQHLINESVRARRSLYLIPFHKNWKLFWNSDVLSYPNFQADAPSLLCHEFSQVPSRRAALQNVDGKLWVLLLCSYLICVTLFLFTWKFFKVNVKDITLKQPQAPSSFNFEILCVYICQFAISVLEGQHYTSIKIIFWSFSVE